MMGGNFFGYEGSLGIEDRGNGQKWLKNVTGFFNLSTRDFPSAPSTITVGLRFYRGHTSKVSLATVYSGPGAVGREVTFGVGDNGAPWIKTGDANGGTIVSGTAIGAGATVYLEFSVYIQNSGGWARIYRNGDLDAEVTGIDTSYAGYERADYVVFLPADTLYGINAAHRFGDFLVHTDTPPIGPVNVYYVPAAAEGGDSDFTPSAGSDNSEMVDEVGPDEDSSYNESNGTSGHRDSFTASGPSGLQMIRSVGVVVRARKTHEGVGALKLGVKHGTSESQSAAHGLSVNYQNFVHFADQNPSTSSAWTAAEAAAAEVGYEVP